MYANLEARLLANSVSAPCPVPTLVCPCRLWTANCNNGGYPRFSKRVGQKIRKVYAHRAAWELKNGPIPADRPELDHLCVIENCIEPSHLEPVTKLENLNRRDARRAAARAAKRIH